MLLRIKAFPLLALSMRAEGGMWWEIAGCASSSSILFPPSSSESISEFLLAPSSPSPLFPTQKQARRKRNGIPASSSADRRGGGCSSSDHRNSIKQRRKQTPRKLAEKKVKQKCGFSTMLQKKVRWEITAGGCEKESDRLRGIASDVLDFFFSLSSSSSHM